MVLITGYIPPYKPLTNISPFTYRDGETYLAILERLRAYVNDELVDFINTNFTGLGDSFELEVNKLISDVNTALDNQTANNATEIANLTDYVNSQIALIINNSIEVVDPAIETIVNDSNSATRTALDTIYSSNNSVDAKIANATPFVNVKSFGAVGDGITDDTGAIRAASIASANLYFPEGTYLISTLDESDSLISYVNVSGINIDASRAEFVNPTSYTADTITAFIKLDNCRDVEIVINNYTGYVLPTPNIHLGYRGVSVLYAVNNTINVNFKATINNARYGVVSGSYSNPALGDCKNFTVDIRGTFIGYPVTFYKAENINFNIDVDDVHRAVYLAGVYDCKGFAAWKNLYIAPIAVLVTDCLISGNDVDAQIDPIGAATSSRGSRNIDIESVDKGSTVQTSSDAYCAGISLSRVDPVEFSDITLKCYVKSNNVLSPKMSGFAINSTAKTINSRYTHNWTTSIVLRNITLTGVVDKSACTIANSTIVGVVIVRAQDADDATKAAVIKNLNLRDFNFIPGNVSTPTSIFNIKGLETPFNIENVQIPTYISIDSPANVPTVIKNSTFNAISLSDVGAHVVMSSGSKAGVLAGTNFPVIQMDGGNIGGTGPVIKQKYTTVNLTGASVNAVNAIPNGCLVLAVQMRIMSAITGSTGYQVGVTGDLTRYANRNETSIGNAVAVGASSEVSPRYYPADTTLIVTSKTSAFTGGSLKILVNYIEFPGMTS